MNWLNSLISIGVYPGLSKNRFFPVRTLNALALVGALGTMTAIANSISRSDPWGLYLVPLFGFVFVLGLNFKRQYYIAAVTEVLVTIGTVLIFGAASENPTWYLCLLPAIVFPFFIFSVEEKNTMIATSTVSLLTYVVTELVGNNDHFPWIELGVGLGMMAFAYLSKRSNDLVELALLEERATSERLLNNFLPAKIAKILRENGNKPPMIAERFDHVSVIFCDIVNFTPMSEKLSPEKLVAVLNMLFTQFDILIEKYKLEKIKTIGDAYMVAGGIPNKMTDHEEAAADFALEMLEVVKQFDQKFNHGLDMRIGMHCGPVVAGVIGKQKFTYDMWGDTVNVAARMESHGLPGEIHISEAMADRLKDKYLLAQRGWVEVKGKGLLQTFWVKQKEANVELNFEEAEETLEMSAEDVTEASLEITGSYKRSSSTALPNPSTGTKKEAKWAKHYQQRISATHSKTERSLTSTEEKHQSQTVNGSTVEQKKKFWEK